MYSFHQLDSKNGLFREAMIVHLIPVFGLRTLAQRLR